MGTHPVPRERHADGLQVPAQFATGTCYHGHDITLEANIQLHRRSQRDRYDLRCGACKRDIDTRRTDRVAATIPPRICEECGHPYSPVGSTGLTGWSQRRYCGKQCQRAVASRRVRVVSTRRALTTPAAALKHLQPKPGWEHDAACRDDDPELWFSTDSSEQAEAVNVCRRWCPVRTACLNAALANAEPDGIWGGMTPKQRDKVGHQLKKQAAA